MMMPECDNGRPERRLQPGPREEAERQGPTLAMLESDLLSHMEVRFHVMACHDQNHVYKIFIIPRFPGLVCKLRPFLQISQLNSNHLMVTKTYGWVFCVISIFCQSICNGSENFLLRYCRVGFLWVMNGL